MKNLDHIKELSPVFYGGKTARILPTFTLKGGENAFSMHWHDRIEFLRIRKGSLLLTVGTNEFEAKSDSVIVFNPCQPHKGIAGDNGVSYDVIMFELSSLFDITESSKDLFKSLMSQNVLFGNTVTDRKTLEIVDTLINEKNIRTLFELSLLFMLMDRLCEIDLIENKPVKYSSSKFDEVIAFINENFTNDITSRDISRQFGYEESYFCRLFKKHTGLKPMVYIKILRLENAQKLLRDKNLSIKEIAFRCGFSDKIYFSHSFKSHYGISPSDYRKVL